MNEASNLETNQGSTHLLGQLINPSHITPFLPARPTPSRAFSMPPPVPAGPSMSGKKKGIVASIHGIAHAESWAIDLMWDLLLRSAHSVPLSLPSYPAPSLISLHTSYSPYF